MKKLMVYPFNKDMCSIARFRHMLEGYELTSAIVPKGFCWEEKDVCELDGGVPTGFILRGDFMEELEQCDSVLLNFHGNKSESVYAEYAAIVRGSGRELISPNQISAITEERHIYPDMPLKEIPVPVVMVMGQGENCQKFEIQLGLREAFRREGYKVTQFGTKTYSHLFGFQSLPDAPELPLWKKIYLYNQLFYETYKQEKPDVMIIGIPGGIMPMNSYTHGLFGETALALTTAARPDMVLLSYYFIEPTKEYFDFLRQYAQFRLNSGKVHFHSSNTKFIDEKSQRLLSYLTLESGFVRNKIAQYDADMPSNLFNALEPESCGPAYSQLIEELQQNVYVL